MKKANLTGSFEFEALEQRVLLSADPVFSAGVPSPADDPFAASESLDEAEETSEESMPGADAEDLFAGVAGEGIGDVDSGEGASDEVVAPVDDEQTDDESDDQGVGVTDVSRGDEGLLGDDSSHDLISDDPVESDVESINEQLLGS